MPDGTVIPEGVSVHERAGKFAEIHEHAHAFVHQKKISSGKHIRCNWIDEGIANWAAVNVLKPIKIDRSLFLDIYDFSFSFAKQKPLLLKTCYVN